MRRFGVILKKIFLWLVGALLLFFFSLAVLLYSSLENRPLTKPAISSATYNEQYLPAIKEAEKWLNDKYESTGLPSLSIAIGIEGELIWAGAIGYSDIENQIPASINTVYPIGSISKSLTATALVTLHDKKLIDMDLPFTNYVPDFPKKAYPFSLKQLAAHQAGIRSYKSGIALFSELFNQTEYSSFREAATTLESDPLLFEPGTKYKYSSQGYTLLALAMERATKREFEEIVRHELFSELAMESTFLDIRGKETSRRTKDYLLFKNNLFVAPSANVSYKYAGAGYLSTPSDLVRLGNGLISGRIMTNESRVQLWTPLSLSNNKKNTDDYALGFKVGKLGESELGVSVRHGGSTNGSFGYFVIYPEHEVVVAFLANAKPISKVMNRSEEMVKIAKKFNEIMEEPVAP